MDHKEVHLRSLLLVIPTDDLLKWMTKIVDASKAGEFLDIITWRPDQGNVFDLQYQPLILADGFYLVPLAILANSNSLRNIYASEFKFGNPLLFDDGSISTLGRQLSESFGKQEFVTATGINHGGGDIDFIAVKADVMIVAECKNYLLPANVFEERNVFDHLLKAKYQLGVITNALAESDKMRAICDRLGVPFINRDVVPVIITNNRLFVGSKFFEFPIRSVHELTHFVEEGTVSTIEGTFRQWKTERLKIDDIREYLSHDGYQVGNVLLEAFAPRTKDYAPHGISLVIHDFVFDPVQALAKIKGLELLQLPAEER